MGVHNSVCISNLHICEDVFHAEWIYDIYGYIHIIEEHMLPST